MSFDYTGSFSGSFAGEITASSGMLSASSQVNYYEIQNKPTTITAFQANQIAANTYFRETLYQDNSASFDSRIDTNSTRIVETNARIDGLSAGSGSADWSTITNIPSGLVSSSTQITNVVSDDYISASAAASGFGSGEGTHTDITDLNIFTSSIQSEVDSLTAATSSYLTSLPSDVVSSSTQVEAIIDDTYISASAAASGFGAGGGTNDFTQLTNVPSGIISSSDQITITESQISDLVHTDISDLNIFSGSVQSQVDALIAATSSYLTSETDSQTLTIAGDQLSISNGNTVTIPSTDTSSFVTNDQTASMSVATASYADFAVSASYEISYETSSSYADSALTASYIDSNLVTAVITDDYISSSAVASGFSIDTTTFITNDVTGSMLVGTASIAVTTDTASYIDPTFISASAAASGFGANFDTSSLVSIDQTSSMSVLSSSFAITASYIDPLFISASAAAAGFGAANAGFGDPPTIDQTGLQINEFTGSGAFVGTLTVTDVTPGDTATWATQSSYTAGYFGISEDGGVTVLSTTTASMNTTAGSGSNNAHPFLVQVTDGQNNIVTGTIYIYVTPNEAPIFRSTSVGGTIITSFTSSTIPEASGSSFVAGTIYFTDSESDTITIGSGSWSVGESSHFTITKNSTNVVITVATSSMDYDTYPYYEMYLTASDSKYPSTDSDSITYLPVRIEVGDNQPPTLNDQTITGLNENSSDAASAGTLTISNTDDNTATIVSMTLVSAYMNGVGTNVTSSMGGVSLYDPHADPFTYSGNTIIRKNGVYLNSDVANRYTYLVGVKDSYDPTTNYGTITIPIADDTDTTITDNWINVYIIESATDQDNLKINSNGLTGTNARWAAVGSHYWDITSDGNFVRATDPSGSLTYLVVNGDISGSIYSYDGTNTINVVLTASKASFETTKQYLDLAVNVVSNDAPDITFTNTTSNHNTNLARSGSTLVTLSFSDSESDAIDYNSFTLTDPSGQLNAVQNSNVFYIQTTENLSGSTYAYTASIKDEHGFRTNVESDSFSISQAPVGGITSNGTLYVIESALSGSNIVISSSGFQGSQADLGVTYSPSYGGASVQSFTSSNAMLAVTNTGLLSLAQDISGSGTGSGDSFTSLITWRDQYDNIGSSTITIAVTPNQAPFVTTDTPDSNNWNTNLATNGTRLTKLVWSDYEADSIDPSTFSLSGAGASSLSSSYSGSNTFEIFANSPLSAASYAYTASVGQTNGFTTGEYNDTITIAQADGGTLTKSGTFYIIESGEAGDSVTINSSGIAGTAAYVGVAYSPNYGSQVAEQFNLGGSGHPYLDINTGTGYLILGGNVSGSAYQAGSSISSNVYWVDQYGNEGTGSIVVDVTNDQNPSATFSDETLQAPVLSGSLLTTVSLTDPESATPFSMSLSGDSAVSMSLHPQNSNSSSYYINLNQDVTSGRVLAYTASVFDAYNQETQYKRSLTIDAPASIPPLWYAYLVEVGVYASDESTALSVFGDGSDNGIIDDDYPFYLMADGQMGTGSLTAPIYTGTGYGDKLFLVASGSTLEGSNSTPLMSNIDLSSGSNGETAMFIVFPSSSVIGTLPDSMTNALGGSTSGQYVLYGDRVGTGIVDAPQSVFVRYFDMTGSATYPNSSDTRIGVMFTQNDATSDISYFFMASSGSAPSSTH